MATKKSSSASRPARGSSRAAAVLALAVAAALGAAGTAQAQAAGEIVVVDLRRVLAETAAARALEALESEERRALRAELDAVKAALEAEEAELVRLRGEVGRDAFDQRVRAFDQKVRAERRAAQEKAQALQERFAGATRALEAAISPALDALMRDRGARLAFDRAAVLHVIGAEDLSDALIARLDAAYPAEAAAQLLVAPAP